LNGLRNPGARRTPEEIRSRPRDLINYNLERQHLEEYMRYTLKNCRVPAVTLNPEGTCTPNGRECSSDAECCSKNCATDPNDPISPRRCR
jgi:hypothetical protein